MEAAGHLRLDGQVRSGSYDHVFFKRGLMSRSEPEPETRKRPGLRASEPALRAFVSSRMRPELQPARDEVVRVLDRGPFMTAWAFEFTPPSAEVVDEAYLRHVREANFVIWIADQEVTDPVKKEVREALSSHRRLIIIRFGPEPRQAAVEELVGEIGNRAKWGAASDVRELREALELAMGDEITRALRDEPGMGRVARLSELARASTARCAARWQAVGLSRAHALALADDPAEGAVGADLLPRPDQPVIFLVAELGAGKSIAAERAHQAALAALRERTDVPVASYLTATEALPGLEQAVLARAQGLGEPRSQGAAVVVDGLDELGIEGAENLLHQARVLVGTWPSSTVLLTSRPLTALAGEERRELPELDEAGRTRCLELALGREVTSGEMASLPQPVRASLGRPLFALLTGLWLRERSGSPRAGVDLLALLGERAARTVGAERAVLERLAVLSVQRDLGAVPPAEVGCSSQVGALEASGMVVRRAGGIVFALPALAQWFAAEALLADVIGVADLLEAPEDLDLWRYPVALALASASFSRAESLMRPLLAVEPGFALIVVDTALAQADVEGSVPPPWREAARQVRTTLQALVDGLGPVSKLIADVDDAGQILPLAASTTDRHFLAAFWRGAEPRPEIFPLPPGFNIFEAGWDWGSIRSATCGTTAAWAWRWSLDDLRQDLERLLRDRALPIPGTGPLADEEVWACALDLTDRPPLVCSELPLTDVLERLERMVEETGPHDVLVYQHVGRRGHEVGRIVDRLCALRDRGDTVLRAPLPVADRPMGGGYTSDFYSPERLVAVGEAMYRQAIEAYCSIVDRWFPTLARRLEHRVLLPARVVGFIDPDHEHRTGRGPRMSGYLEPLAAGEQSAVCMRVAREFDRSLAQGVYARQRAARPEAARWISGTIGGMAFEVGHRYPVSEVVYRWLAGDLVRLRMLGRNLVGGGSRTGVVPWDTV